MASVSSSGGGGGGGGDGGSAASSGGKQRRHLGYTNAEVKPVDRNDKERANKVVAGLCKCSSSSRSRNPPCSAAKSCACVRDGSKCADECGCDRKSCANPLGREVSFDRAAVDRARKDAMGQYARRESESSAGSAHSAAKPSYTNASSSSSSSAAKSSSSASQQQTSLIQSLPGMRAFPDGFGGGLARQNSQSSLASVQSTPDMVEQEEDRDERKARLTKHHQKYRLPARWADGDDEDGATPRSPTGSDAEPHKPILKQKSPPPPRNNA